MNAAETSASSAIADWTPLTVVPRSWTTAEIETFISDVSTTSTNIAIDSRIASRWLLAASVPTSGLAASVMGVDQLLLASTDLAAAFMSATEALSTADATMWSARSRALASCSAVGSETRATMPE